MPGSRLDISRKALWGADFFTARERMSARTSRIVLHFIAGLLVAAYVAPEGAAVASASLLLVALMKALYDYVDSGSVYASNAVALIAGGAVSLSVALAI